MKKDDEMTHSFENPSDSHTISENSSDSHLSEKRKLWLGKRSNIKIEVHPLGFYFCSFLSFVTLNFFFCHPSTNIIGLYGIGSVGKITILQKKKNINNEYFGIEKNTILKKLLKN